MAEYVDFKEHIQSLLDEIAPNTYKVFNERELKSYFEGAVIVSAQIGNVSKKSATLPYQIDVLSSDPDKVINDFTKLAKEYNNTLFESVGEETIYTIKQFYQTPTIMEKDIEVGSLDLVRLVLFANLFAVEGVNNLKKLTIDGEEIETLNSSLSYVSETHDNKVSGSDYIESKNRLASVMITFTALDNMGVFGNKLFQIQTKQLIPNTPFNVYFEKLNGQSAILTMMVKQAVTSNAQNSLASINVAMVLYDTRGDNNA